MKKLRKIIIEILIKYFVPMSKHERFKWERIFIKYRIPFKNMIWECWDTEIKQQHPNIASWK